MTIYWINSHSTKSFGIIIVISILISLFSVSVTIFSCSSYQLVITLCAFLYKKWHNLAGLICSTLKQQLDRLARQFKFHISLQMTLLLQNKQYTVLLINIFQTNYQIKFSLLMHLEEVLAELPFIFVWDFTGEPSGKFTHFHGDDRKMCKYAFSV